MTGWKTKAAAAGLILSGLGMIIAGIVAEVTDVTKILEGWTLIMAGLAALGIGHKIEKAAPSG
jgi:sulfite exporter TauE/SafE